MAASIDPKPAAALFGGSLSALGIGLLNRYTNYHPTLEEAMNISILAGFLVAWFVPNSLWQKAEEAGVVEAHAPVETGTPGNVPDGQAA